MRVIRILFTEGHMVSFRNYAEEIQRQTRLRTYPLAIKMLLSEADIPTGSVRPRRDLKRCIAACQGFVMSRMSGSSVAMLKEDMWCYLPVIAYGMAPAPAEFLDGRNRYPLGENATLEAAAHWASEQFPRFENGKYVGVASAPLATANFDPDLVVIYSNTLQLIIFLHAIGYSDGNDLSTKLSRSAACAYSVVCPLRENKCWVSIPCLGDRRRAMAADDEIILSIPASQMHDFMTGLRKCEKQLPYAPALMPEYPLPPEYSKMARMLGMTRADGGEIK